MIELVIGGSSSGKSEYAEGLLSEVTTKKYYVATMQPFGEANEKQIARHRKLRAGKHFETIERQRNLDALKLPQHADGVLLECMSNLLANEMYAEDKTDESLEALVTRIVTGCKTLAAQTKRLVIVTNNISEDGITYDSSTEEYIKALSLINRSLAEIADTVTEVVVGLPLTIK